MKQKIYAKFTKERLPQFQIETQIYEEDGKRWIRKRALLPEGKSHIEKLYENYIFFKDKEPGLLAPVKQQEDGVEFEYIQGESLAKKLDDKVFAGDKEGFFELLSKYHKLIQTLTKDVMKYEDAKEKEATLGVEPLLENESYASKVNADLTFDNVLVTEDGNMKVIDYEWIFDCPLPIRFPLYRALYAYFLRSHNELSQMISLEECREHLHMDSGVWTGYEKMNESFNAYIMGKEEGYGNVLARYAQKSISLDDIMAMNEEAAQIYIDRGQGFSEENSIRENVETDGTLNVLEVKLTGDEINIRMDPMNAGGLVEVTEVCLADANSGKTVTPKMTSTADSVQGNHYLFLKEDPQFIFKLKKIKAGYILRFSYRILSRLTDQKM